MQLLKFRSVLILLSAPLTVGAVLLQSPVAEHPAIRYSDATPADPVGRLAQKLAQGEEKLVFDAERGYLPSLLSKLHVPVSSQSLVFSKTSLQLDKIWPRRPRALYFNDDVYIGWIPDAPLLEFASVDPKLGTVFYTLEQVQSRQPKLERQTTECVLCHDGSSTGGVPGLIMRSVYPDSHGNAILRAGTFLTNDRSPWRERWGGWYVSGTHGDAVHMGNLMAPEGANVVGGGAKHYLSQVDMTSGSNLKDITEKFDSEYYLSPHSDIVALLVLTHQTNVHNLITRTNYEARIAEFDQEKQIPASLRNTAEALVRAMLFTGEPQLAAPVVGTSGFTQHFTEIGLRDSKGRSLRDLDLNRRLFRYPLSYLIYSDAFDALPGLAKDFVYRRLREILTGKDTSGQFEHLSAADRSAILEILKDTRPGW
jgi:hypothetical protein